MGYVAVSRRHAMFGLLLIGFAAALGCHNARAFDPSSIKAVNIDSAGLMLHGYDPVSYFATSKATKGSPKYSAPHKGATYHFVSAANRDAFIANPAKYEPQFGGFCAMGVAHDKKLDGDPEVFRIVDGKLYLNLNRDVQKRWSEDPAANISNANAKRPLISQKTPKELN